jgi:serine/threonine protein phosphatase PrpC
MLVGGQSGRIDYLNHGRYQAGGLVDIGGRDYQQDGLLFAGEAELAVVADGLGGHLDGEKASASVLKTLAREFANKDIFDFPAALKAAGWQLRRDIAAGLIRSTGETPTGTTIVGAHRDPVTNILTIAKLGDSRAYLFRDSQLQILTLDDVWEMEGYIKCDFIFNEFVRQLGKDPEAACQAYRALTPPLTSDQSRLFSRLVYEHGQFGIFANRIGKYLGDNDEGCETPTLLKLQMQANDLVLLTSDGAHGSIDYDDLSQTIAAHSLESPLAIAQAIKTALSVPEGQDNNTIAVLRAAM